MPGGCVLGLERSHDENCLFDYQTTDYLWVTIVRDIFLLLIAARSKIVLFFKIMSIRKCVLLYLQRAHLARYFKTAKREEVARSQFLSSYAPHPVLLLMCAIKVTKGCVDFVLLELSPHANVVLELLRDAKWKITQHGCLWYDFLFEVRDFCGQELGVLHL